MWLLNYGLDRAAYNLLPAGNNAISTGYSSIIQYNLQFCMTWLRHKVYCCISLLMQTCWETRKLDVFIWDKILKLNNHHTFVTHHDDNNQQGCAYFLLEAHACQTVIFPVNITWRTPKGVLMETTMKDERKTKFKMKEKWNICNFSIFYSLLIARCSTVLRSLFAANSVCFNL